MLHQLTRSFSAGCWTYRLSTQKAQLASTRAPSHHSHSNTGSYLSIFMSNTYTGTEEDANVARFRPKIRVQFSRNPREDIRFLSYVRIYIIMERKEGFSFPLQIRSCSRMQNFLLTHLRGFYLNLSSGYFVTDLTTDVSSQY